MDHHDAAFGLSKLQAPPEGRILVSRSESAKECATVGRLLGAERVAGAMTWDERKILCP